MKITTKQLKQLIREQVEEIKRPKRPSRDHVWNDAWGRWYGDGSEPEDTPEEAAAYVAERIKQSILSVVNAAEQGAAALPQEQYAKIILDVAKEVASEVAQRPDKEY